MFGVWRADCRPPENLQDLCWTYCRLFLGWRGVRSAWRLCTQHLLDRKQGLLPAVSNRKSTYICEFLEVLGEALWFKLTILHFYRPHENLTIDLKNLELLGEGIKITTMFHQLEPKQTIFGGGPFPVFVTRFPQIISELEFSYPGALPRSFGGRRPVGNREHGAGVFFFGGGGEGDIQV